MSNNAVNEAIEIPIEQDIIDESSGNEGFRQAIQELGEAVFLNYEEKTSNLTSKNISGMIKIEVLNDFMERRYGFRYTELDVLVLKKRSLVVSQKGYGLTQFIEALKAIQASFVQQEIPMGTMQRLIRR
jgi:hypothetical protein